jgi:hypothetical protein
MTRVKVENGKISFIYKDELRPLFEAGETFVKRVSHVEPDGKEWTADLSPIQGPVLGPFETRREALEAELAWLDENEFGE